MGWERGADRQNAGTLRAPCRKNRNGSHQEDIDRYAQRMEPPYEVVVYHHLENGFDERLDYQTLAEAEQAAQKYVAGTGGRGRLLPMMALVSMTWLSMGTDGCGFTGTSPENEPVQTKQNKPLRIWWGKK